MPTHPSAQAPGSNTTTSSTNTSSSSSSGRSLHALALQLWAGLPQASTLHLASALGSVITDHMLSRHPASGHVAMPSVVLRTGLPDPQAAFSGLRHSFILVRQGVWRACMHAPACMHPHALCPGAQAACRRELTPAAARSWCSRLEIPPTKTTAARRHAPVQATMRRPLWWTPPSAPTSAWAATMTSTPRSWPPCPR